MFIALVTLCVFSGVVYICIYVACSLVSSVGEQVRTSVEISD